MSALPIGTKLQNGNFTVGKVIGQGGFGITYYGSDTQLNRLVAIKEFFLTGSTRSDYNVLPQGTFDSSSYHLAKSKFLNEARTLAQFRHESIVHVYTFFEENNTAYLVMEFLKGQTLTQLVESCGVLPEEQAVEITKKVANAVEELHRNNVLHRDIKPDNIIACDDGRIALIDFGLTKKVEESIGSSTRHLSTTAAFGSDEFAPPEQYLKSGVLGPYTDVYALGATLYFLLTGKVPPSAIERLAGESLTPPQEIQRVNPNVNDTVVRAMELKGDTRLQNIHHFLKALAQSQTNHVFQPTNDITIQTPTNVSRVQQPKVGSGKCKICGTPYPKSFNQCQCGAMLPWATQASIHQVRLARQAKLDMVEKTGMRPGEAIQNGMYKYYSRCSSCFFKNYLRSWMTTNAEITCWKCSRHFVVSKIEQNSD